MTLAQDYLDHGFVMSHDSEVVKATHELLIECLKPLDEQPASGRAVTKAEQFVFDQNVPEVMQSLIEDGNLRPRIIFDTARLPADVCWVEWPAPSDEDPKCRVGMLLAKAAIAEGQRNLIAVAFVMGTEDKVACFGLLGFPQLPLLAMDQIAISWWQDYNAGNVPSEVVQESIASFSWDLLDALFLIMTPRVCEVRESEHSPRLQRRREKIGKLPLVEYKKMILRVGVGKPRYVKHAGDPKELVPGTPTGRHNRLHSVIGHFRTYRRGRDAPFATFVPQHWRGDPELGIVLRERHVRKE